MEIVLAFIFGVIAGIIASISWMYHKTVFGYFSLTKADSENPELYNINISVPERAYLLDKDKIILRNITKRCYYER